MQGRSGRGVGEGLLFQGEGAMSRHGERLMRVIPATGVPARGRMESPVVTCPTTRNANPGADFRSAFLARPHFPYDAVAFRRETTPMARWIAVVLLLCSCLSPPLVAGSAIMAKPEEVGLSSERLVRIREAVQRHIDAKAVSGAVTLVARQGRIVHLEAHGSIDIRAKPR